LLFTVLILTLKNKISHCKSGVTQLQAAGCNLKALMHQSDVKNKNNKSSFCWPDYVACVSAKKKHLNSLQRPCPTDNYACSRGHNSLVQKGVVGCTLVSVAETGRPH